MNTYLKNKKKVIMRNPNYIIKSKGLITALLIVVASLFTINTASAESGDVIFKQNCAACHKLSSKHTVAPGLAGLADRREKEWLMKWIKNSNDLIDVGDEYALQLVKDNNGINGMVPYSQFSDDEISGVIDYIFENGIADSSGGGTASSVEASEEGDITLSDSQSTIIFWAIVFIILIILYFVSLQSKVERLIIERGIFPDPHSIKNYPSIFMGTLIVASVIICAITFGLQNNIGTINIILFGVFPFVAFAIFILGSVYRYTKKGYKVSSLSTQFLEGKKLFWGSQPFHWGLLVLLFGHLIAFLFPSALIAWNGAPVRLLILEFSSFVFALLALLGLVLLIKRRLTSKTLLVVTNKMDMVVYTILLTQIVSGLGVAFFVRWGSTWFASVLTPYLRSIFSFNPDLGAISEAPVLVQIHVISAFLMIAIIPFTRFMHFLVAPVDYIWRKYQVVIWNWNRKTIRKSTRHNFGKRPRNH
jgi:nitrate reductase gamma subunit